MSTKKRSPMSQSSDTVEDRARKTFRRRKIMTLVEVAELIHSSIHTRVGYPSTLDP